MYNTVYSYLLICKQMMFKEEKKLFYGSMNNEERRTVEYIVFSLHFSKFTKGKYAILLLICKTIDFFFIIAFHGKS